MNKEVSLRKLNSSDVNEMARLHHHSFKDFFLTSLGENFLKVFYKEIIKDKDGLGIGAFNEDNKLVGFAVGAQQNTGFYSRILKANWMGLLWSAIPKLILSPKKVKRLLHSITSSGEQDYVNTPILLSICVDPSQGSKGIGHKLLKGFEDLLKEFAYDSLILSTDAHNNNYPNQFYLKNNYNFVKSFFQGKREMNLYYKKLTL